MINCQLKRNDEHISCNTQQGKKAALPRRLRAETNHALQVGRKPGCEVFLTRGLRALTRLAEELRPEALTDAAAETTDYAVLLTALGNPEALSE